MLYALVGLAAAGFFGIVSFAIYGAEGLIESAWVDYVFWTLIGVGATASLLDRALRCRLCDISARLRRWEPFCQDMPCHGSVSGD